MVGEWKTKDRLMMDMIEQIISEAIKRTSHSLPSQIIINRPRADFGDYSTNVALLIAKDTSQNPREMAEKIAGELKGEPYISSAEAAGPGFINLKVSDEWLEKQLTIPYQLEKFLSGHKYIIEYSSPNIAKPMHVGHLRTTILGQTLVNLYRILGAEVVSWSHLGDWGVQFGKLIAGWQKWGDYDALKNDPIEELLRVYVKFHQEEKADPSLTEQGRDVFKKLQSGEPKLKALWEEFTKYSLVEFEKIYKRLGVNFDVCKGESAYNDRLQAIVDRALSLGVARISEGAVIISLDEYNLPPLLIRKSDGATLYATADLALIEAKESYNKPEEIINVVGNEQTLYLQQCFAATKKLTEAGLYGRDFKLPKLTHVSYGFFRLATGKMSTRQGDLIRLDDVLDQATESARMLLLKKNDQLNQDKLGKLTEVMGVAAVKYTDLMHDRHTDVVFDWDKMFALEGNSVIYLMYTYARCNSLLSGVAVNSGQRTANNGYEAWTENERRLTLSLLETDQSIEKSVNEYDPHYLINHIYKVASDFSRFYNSDRILKTDANIQKRRIKIVEMVKDQLKIMFDVLGIIPPEKL